MDQVAAQEREKYELLWGEYPEYRDSTASNNLLPIFIELFSPPAGSTVIDFGCGRGRAAPLLLEADLNVQLVDICRNCLDPDIYLQTLSHTVCFTQACLWDLPSNLEPAEWMICFDVLEHLPEEKVLTAIAQIASRVKQGGLVSISTREDHLGKLIDKALHLTVRPAVWWREKLSVHFEIFEVATRDDVLVWALRKG